MRDIPQKLKGKDVKVQRSSVEVVVTVVATVVVTAMVTTMVGDSSGCDMLVVVLLVVASVP